MTPPRKKPSAWPQTSQDLRLGARRVRLDDQQLLGVGGEARVYGLPGEDLALKIYHPIDVRLTRSEKQLAELQRKQRFDKLAHFPRNLPSAVIAPLELVTEARTREPVGYAMRRIDGAHELLRLGQRHFREGVISNQQVTALFRALYLTVAALHGGGVVIGDFNDGNALFVAPSATASPTTTSPATASPAAPGGTATATGGTAAGGPVWLIDADSMHFDRFPCVVAHERFLDPRLYGRDLGGAGGFGADSDWYAFATLLFASLLYVHPYGGVHPKHGTLLRRAEARVSVLDRAVIRPKVAADPRVLDDGLRDYFAAVFDADRRGVFPATLLELRWSRCSRCGVEHARPQCPLCQTVVPNAGLATATLPWLAPDDSRRVIDHGACRATTIFRTSGRILGATLAGKLRWVYEEREVVRREDGQRVFEQALTPGLRFAISGASTWIGLGSRLVRIEGETPRERTQTALGPDALPAFAVNSAGCYRIEDDWLVDHATATRVGPVLPGQTWLRVGEGLGCGFYRAGLLTIAFVFDTTRPGLLPVSLPPIEGHLVDAACAFDEKHVLLGLASELGGRRKHALYLLDAHGRLLGQRSGAPEDAPFLASVRGKALAGGRVLSASDEGLLTLSVDSGQLVAGRLFSDTRPFVGAETELFAGSGGSVYAVTTHEILQLTLQTPTQNAGNKLNTATRGSSTGGVK